MKTVKEIQSTLMYETRLQHLRDALVEIRDVAKASEGVGFYAMLAEQALEKDDSSQ